MEVASISIPENKELIITETNFGRVCSFSSYKLVVNS
jgi:hypothetical protein